MTEQLAAERRSKCYDFERDEEENAHKEEDIDTERYQYMASHAKDVRVTLSEGWNGERNHYRKRELHELIGTIEYTFLS